MTNDPNEEYWHLEEVLTASRDEQPPDWSNSDRETVPVQVDGETLHISIE